MSGAVFGDSFRGSGSIDTAAAAVTTGVTGSWIAAGFYRSGPGLMHNAAGSMEGLTSFIGGANTLGTGVAVFEFAFWGDPRARVEFNGAGAAYAEMHVYDDGYVVCDISGSTSSSSNGARPLTTRSVARIEIEAGVARFYLDNVLLYSGGIAGVSSASTIHAVSLIYPFGDSYHSVLTGPTLLVDYVHFKTQVLTGALGAPAMPDPNATKLSVDRIYGMRRSVSWDFIEDTWILFAPPGALVTLSDVTYPTESGAFTNAVSTRLSANVPAGFPSNSLFHQEANGQSASVRVPSPVVDAAFKIPAGVPSFHTVETIMVGSEKKTFEFDSLPGKYFSSVTLDAISYDSLIPDTGGPTSGLDPTWRNPGTMVQLDLLIQSYSKTDTTTLRNPARLVAGPVPGAIVTTVVYVDFLTPADVSSLEITLGADAPNPYQIDESLPPAEQRKAADAFVAKNRAKLKAEVFSDFWTKFQQTYEVP